jgi:hypothetical protein
MYSSFIAAYIWFMYWIAQDFFVWHKPFSEVNPVNYIGSIAAIAFIWAGTKILKPDRTQQATPQIHTATTTDTTTTTTSTEISVAAITATNAAKKTLTPPQILAALTISAI